MPASAVQKPPDFLGSVDRVLLDLPVPPGGSLDAALGQAPAHWMDVTLRAFEALEGKPIILNVACPADPELQTQVDCYQALLSTLNGRDWVSGFVSAGFFPAAAMRDKSYSIYGKPAAELLGLWFPLLLR
jgi:hypothetical protein